MTLVDNGVSVIIPLYNKENTVCRAIASVMSQTVPAREVIVIDDGSTDSSRSLVEKEFGESVTLINQVNMGVSVARNVGVQRAQADFVAFLDADDTWEPCFIERFSRAAAREQIALWSCRYHLRKPLGNVLAECTEIRWPVGSISREQYYSLSLKSPLITSSSVVVKKASLQEAGGFPEGVGVGEDLVTWARLMDKNYLYLEDMPLANYFFDTNSSLHVASLKKNAPEELLGFFEARYCESSLEEKIYYLVLLCRSFSALAIGRKKLAILKKILRIGGCLLFSFPQSVQKKFIVMRIIAHAILVSLLRPLRFFKH